MFSFNLRVIDAPGVFHEGRFLLDVVIHDVASSTATKQRRIRPFGSPDENVSVVRPSNPFEWPLTTRQIGRRARLELPRGRVVYAKGVTELLTDIGCEAWRVDGKLQHVREVFWRRSGNGVIEAEVLTAHMRETPEKPVEDGVLARVCVTERFRHHTDIAIDEHHASLVTMYVERDDMSPVLMSKDFSEVLAQLAQSVATTVCVTTSGTFLGLVEFERAVIVVNFGLDGDDDVRIRASSDEGGTGFFGCSLAPRQEILRGNIDVILVSVVGKEDCRVACCSLSCRGATLESLFDFPVCRIPNDDSFGLLPLARALENAIRKLTLDPA